MDKALYFSPSLYAHIVNAILLLTAVILLFANYSKIQKNHENSHMNNG